MNHDIELLAPAGSWEAMIAAVQNGADAVYLGAKAFNARQYAGNFDDEQLKHAVEYCHVRGVNVYLTVNTLLNDRELDKLPGFIMYVHNIGIDAVIVQDLGVARLVKEIAPELSLHASTQMTIHNLAGVKILEQMGFERVVLARELNRQEIQHICRNTSMEIEIFVHGALCMSYSGQCLMSSMIGGRSGNRGRCAQPCRLPYALMDMNSGKIIHDNPKRQYLLSPRDLSLIEHLNDLRKAGVKSLKIEGRMKRPEYVAVVAKQYRYYLDSGLTIRPEHYEDLLKAFNRGGFTQGYFKDEMGEHMMSYAKPKNWGIYIGDIVDYNKKKNIASIRLKRSLNVGDGIEVWTEEAQDPGLVVGKMYINNNEAHSAKEGQTVSISITGDIEKGDKVYKTSDIELVEAAKSSFVENVNIKSVSIYGSCRIGKKSPIHLNIWDDYGNYAEATGDKPAEDAIHKELTEDKVVEQLNKLGGTPYRFQDISVDIEPGLALPISEINNVRRYAIEQLEQQRIRRHVPSQINVLDAVKNIDKLINGVHYEYGTEQTKLAVQIDNYAQAKALLDIGADRLYLSVEIFAMQSNDDLRSIVKEYISREIDIFCVLPRIIRDKNLKQYEKFMRELDTYSVKGIVLSNIGHIQLAESFGYHEIYGDFGLNVFNSLSALKCRELGMKGVTLSPELTFRQIGDISRYSNLENEIMIYGRLPLMTFQNCPVGSLSNHLDKTERCDCNHRAYGLVDRKGMAFPLRTNRVSCQTEVLNSQPVFLADKMDEVLSSKIDGIRLLFTTESPSRCKEIALVYKDALRLGTAKAVEKHREIIEGIMAEGFTRGHYYRGVE